MASLELVVAIGLAVLVVTAVARHVHVPPALLLVAGILLGLVPALRETHLPPEAVLLLFLPILLCWESFTSSWREIRSNARVVVLLSTVLVVLTAALVALAAHALGMMWGPAWVLGAAVAPTDDRRLQDPVQHVLLALVAPLSAYLLAEAVEASGSSPRWSAACGSAGSRRGCPAAARREVQTQSFSAAMLNPALFVLVGLEVVSAVGTWAVTGLARWADGRAWRCRRAVDGCPFGWLFTSPYLIRVLGPAAGAAQAPPRSPSADRHGGGGVPGAVSLAAALAVPQTLGFGGAVPGPGRDRLRHRGRDRGDAPGPGPLRRRVRWARLQATTRAVEQERRRAEIVALEEAMEALPGLVEELGTDGEVAEQLRTEYDRRLRILCATDHDEPAAEPTP